MFEMPAPRTRTRSLGNPSKHAPSYVIKDENQVGNHFEEHAGMRNQTSALLPSRVRKEPGVQLRAKP